MASWLVADPAWPALCQALVGAEQEGWSPDRLLPAAAALGQLDTAESPARVLAARIDKYVRWRDAPAPARPANQDLPPWIAAPPPDSLPPEWRDYLAKSVEFIVGRVRYLADQAAAEQPSWLHAIGPPPSAGPPRSRWLQQVGVVAAYREHYGVRHDRPLDDCPAEPSRRQQAWLAASAALPTLTAGPSSTRPSTPAARRTRGRSFC